MMKRILLVALAMFLGAGIAAAQEDIDQSLMAELKENIFRVGVNMDPYEYIPGERTAVPKGYKPFYISHYGRHGSRSNWAGRMYAAVLEKYNKAYEAGILTQEGQKARNLIAEAVRLHDNMDGRLTLLGQQEHSQIATRMYNDYKRVFKKGSKKIFAVSSMVPRCIISMNSATAQLRSLDPALDIRYDTGDTFQKYVSSDHTRQMQDSISVIMDNFSRRHVPDTAGFLRKIFTDPAKGREVTGDPVELMSETFWMGTTCPAFGLGDGLYRMFSWEDLYHYSQGISMDFYLGQCNSVEFGDIRMPRAKPLLDDIVAKADAAIATEEYCADLRYGHDYQVLAISSLLGLDGVAQRLDQKGCEKWHGWKYTPFAANVQMIFYKNKKGDVLVKFLLNERETALVGMAGGPYYNWKDVKKYLGY